MSSSTAPDSGTREDRLRAAAARRSLDAEQRVRAALRKLDRDGAQINFAAVAHAAQVSRTFLYNHPEFRAEIQALRTPDRGTATKRLPARHRSSDESLRTRLRAALDDNKHQRAEIAQLRDELAIAHGRVRDLELQHRTRQ